MILLDTNILSELMRSEPDPVALCWVDAQPREEFYVSAVTRAEIGLGIALLPDGRRKQALADAARRMFAGLPGRCVPFDESAASRYGDIVAARVRQGRPMSVEDAQIAAIAVAGGFVLATRNVGDFTGIDGLTLVDPFSA